MSECRNSREHVERGGAVERILFSIDLHLGKEVAVWTWYKTNVVGKWDTLIVGQVEADIHVVELGPSKVARQGEGIPTVNSFFHALKQGQVGLIEGLGEVNFCLGGGIPQGQMEQDKGTE